MRVLRPNEMRRAWFSRRAQLRPRDSFSGEFGTHASRLGANAAHRPIFLNPMLHWAASVRLTVHEACRSGRSEKSKLASRCVKAVGVSCGIFRCAQNEHGMEAHSDGIPKPRMKLSAHFLALLCVVAAVVSCLGAEKANVIFIVADDLGYGELGSYGGKDIPTRDLAAPQPAKLAELEAAWRKLDGEMIEAMWQQGGREGSSP